MKRYTVTLTNQVFYDIIVEVEDSTSDLDIMLEAQRVLGECEDPGAFISGESFKDGVEIEEL